MVKWLGYEDMDWIPTEHYHCPDRITEFLAVPRVNHLETTPATQGATTNPYHAVRGASKVRSSRASVRKAKPSETRRVARDPKTGRFAKRRDHRKTPERTKNDNAAAGEWSTDSRVERDVLRSSKADKTPLSSPIYGNTCRDKDTGELNGCRSENTQARFIGT